MKKRTYIIIMICAVIAIATAGCHTSKAGKTGQHKGHSWDMFQ